MDSKYSKNNKSQSRRILETKRENIMEAAMHAKPHPLYPGLELAKLHKAQYKLVHVVSKMYFRIYAQDKLVTFLKGVFYPNEVLILSEFEWVYKTRKEANDAIREMYTKLQKEGYIWEGNAITHEEAMSHVNYETMVAGIQTIDRQKADEKYQYFEGLLKTVV